MDDDYNLKINDFGFAGPVHGSQGSGWFTTNLGTPANMAPELLAKSAYQGTQVDLFASGVVIFTMLSRHPPFVKASSTDYYYKYFPQNKSKKFWDAHSKAKEPGYYSADFMHFFNSLMQFEPTQRPSIQEILHHPWLQGETLSHEQVRAEMIKRKELI